MLILRFCRPNVAKCITQRVDLAGNVSLPTSLLLSYWLGDGLDDRRIVVQFPARYPKLLPGG